MPVDRSLAVSIAGWSISLEFEEIQSESFTRIADWYSEFAVGRTDTDFRIRVRVELGDPYFPIDQNPVWPVHTCKINSRVEFQSFFEAGWVDFRDRVGELVMRPQGNPENFLRVLYAWLSVADGSLLVHASGIVRNGRGYVFFGHSGSGKTTISGLAGQAIVLSDDLAILRKQAGGYVLCGVPFRGEMPEAPRANVSAPLRGIFALAKDTMHRLDRVALPEATGRLSSCVPFVMDDPSAAARVVDICAQVVAQYPVRLLHFARDPGFWKVIDELG